MPDELLTAAREQAERSEPGVRVAALLRIARVESAVNREQTRETFEQALTETRGITGAGGGFLLGHARLIAAAVAPDLLVDIPAVDHLPRHVASEMLGGVMLDQRRLDLAVGDS